MLSDNLLIVILEWAWVSLFLVVTWLIRKVMLIEPRVTLLEKEHKQELEATRQQLHDIKAALKEHNSAVTTRLQSIEEFLRAGNHSS